MGVIEYVFKGEIGGIEQALISPSHSIEIAERGVFWGNLRTELERRWGLLGTTRLEKQNHSRQKKRNLQPQFFVAWRLQEWVQVQREGTHCVCLDFECASLQDQTPPFPHLDPLGDDEMVVENERLLLRRVYVPGGKKAQDTPLVSEFDLTEEEREALVIDHAPLELKTHPTHIFMAANRRPPSDYVCHRCGAIGAHHIAQCEWLTSRAQLDVTPAGKMRWQGILERARNRRRYEKTLRRAPAGVPKSMINTK